MGEEFGTVNLRRSESREIELLRKHYRAHRDTLARMISDAPSEHLASEYQRLISEIDMALRKLEELEGKLPAATPPPNADTNPMMRTGPGTRPLVRPNEPVAPPREFTPASNHRSRIALIVVAGIIVLGVIGWLIWRASSGPGTVVPAAQHPVTTATAATAARPPAVTPAPPPAPLFSVKPLVADYGTIKKGTRAVRQFQITNLSDAPVDIEVVRSSCHCLFYDYNTKLPAKGTEAVTVTIDGARVRPGPLQEQIEVHSRKDPAIKTAFQVRATVK